MRTARTARFLFTRLLIPAIAVVIVATVIAQKSGTETSYRYDDAGSLIRTDTTYKEGRVIERKEFDKLGKLRKRTTYTYLNGFKVPNTSETEYHPNGETPRTTTNVDHDKDGDATSTQTTNYDGAGKEIGGSKRERDPKTGKERCYNWNAAKQVYEEKDCPKLFVSQIETNSRVPVSKDAQVEISGGLQIVTFDTAVGTVRVNLPDDMRAGDTISGTVIAEPKGQTTEERAKNQNVLNGLVLEINGKTVVPFTVPPAKERESVIQQTFWIYNPNAAGVGSPAPTATPLQPISRPMATSESGGTARFSVALMKPQPSGQELARAIIPYYVGELPGTTQSGAVITPDPKITPTFTIPRLGQTGRPIVITGPFDGNSENTKLTIGDQPGALLAESPRKVVVASPPNVVGPVNVSVNEGDKETKGAFRNLKIDLTAPKTSLLKGESTELHVQVNGLEGITQPVPLTLQSRGVITMVGGMYQPLVIQPSEVGADGRYTTTRGITGVQTGGWEATATVVTHRFDACLQDDSSGSSFVFDPKGGDYIFWQPGTAATNSVILPWIAQTRGSLVELDPKLVNPGVTFQPCVIILDHNLRDRTIHAQINICAHTGSASVQTSPPNKPKASFIITDRNIADNTCSNQ